MMWFFDVLNQFWGSKAGLRKIFNFISYERFQRVFRNLAQISLNNRFRAHIQEAEYRSKSKKSKIRLGQVLSKTILHKCLPLRWWAYTRNLGDTKLLFWSPRMQKVPTFLKKLDYDASNCIQFLMHQLFEPQSLNGTPKPQTHILTWSGKHGEKDFWYEKFHIRSWAPPFRISAHTL